MNRILADPGRPGRTLLRLARLAAAIEVALVASTHARHRRDLAGRARWLQRACRLGLRALGVRLRVKGRPPGSAIVAANHLGYLDVLVLGALAPTVFVAKREVAGWPVFGGLARLAGTRFIDRNKRADVRRVADELAAPLAAGVNVVLFLEGTSTDGATVRPFKSSLLEPAAQGRLPVVPAAITFGVPAGYSAARDVCWWGDMTLAPHLFNLASLPWIDAQVAWGGEVDAAGDRKVLARELQHRVAELLAGLRSQGAPKDTVARRELEWMEAVI